MDQPRPDAACVTFTMLLVALYPSGSQPRLKTAAFISFHAWLVHETPLGRVDEQPAPESIISLSDDDDDDE